MNSDGDLRRSRFSRDISMTSHRVPAPSSFLPSMNRASQPFYSADSHLRLADPAFRYLKPYACRTYPWPSPWPWPYSISGLHLSSSNSCCSRSATTLSRSLWCSAIPRTRRGGCSRWGIASHAVPVFNCSAVHSSADGGHRCAF